MTVTVEFTEQELWALANAIWGLENLGLASVIEELHEDEGKLWRYHLDRAMGKMARAEGKQTAADEIASYTAALDQREAELREAGIL